MLREKLIDAREKKNYPETFKKMSKKVSGGVDRKAFVNVIKK